MTRRATASTPAATSSASSPSTCSSSSHSSHSCARASRTPARFRQCIRGIRTAQQRTASRPSLSALSPRRASATQEAWSARWMAARDSAASVASTSRTAPTIAAIWATACSKWTTTAPGSATVWASSTRNTSSCSCCTAGLRSWGSWPSWRHTSSTPVTTSSQPWTSSLFSLGSWRSCLGPWSRALPSFMCGSCRMPSRRSSSAKSDARTTPNGTRRGTGSRNSTLAPLTASAGITTCHTCWGRGTSGLFRLERGCLAGQSLAVFSMWT
mmetsp:Transcript_18803/g.60006  ORF Transcript_18803/g.60006 Transcript_18803/m.60006 type:complete len:269 (+) Transcript_18803:249-1055(+)